VSYQDFADEEEKSFFKRNRILIVVGVVLALIIGTVGVLVKMYGKIPPPHKPEEIVIHLQPPPPMPPPPPPPPPPPQPPEQKFVEQPKDLKPLEKPKDEMKNPDKPPGPPAAASGPPSDFGLGGPGGGGGGDGGGGGGSRWGWYAGEVQARIAEALRQNDKTKDARLRVKVRIWVNNSGSITRASLADSSGDPSLDDALKNQILTGLNLPEAPPSDMPMPIVMLINEQRPN
jgi:periplasmic protein TonB